MTDLQEARAEYAALDEKRRLAGLAPDEQARWEELRGLGAADPDTEALPISSSFEGWGAAPEPSPGETTAVSWDQGPVEAPPPLPPPDPAYAAVVVELPEEEGVQEISAEEVEDLVEVEVVPGIEVVADGPAVVSWPEGDAEGGEVVPLDSLLVTPPPVHAESLAPPLPPPAVAPPPVPPFPAVPPAPPQARVRPPDLPAAGPDPFAPSPSFVAGEHRVVLHTVGGQVLRGAIANADLCDAELPMIQPNGAVARVPAGQVKAIFFMLEAGERAPPGAGTRVQVTFGDGRQLAGLAPDYSPAASGFFVLPADARTHTSRVWVQRTAIRQISVG